MSLKVEQWTDQDYKVKLASRLTYAKEYRRDNFEYQWRENEELFYNGRGYQSFSDFIADEEGSQLIDGESDPEASQYDVAINYVFRYIRYFLSQMSANPPVAKFIPNSTDLVDLDRANNADRTARYLRHKLDLDDIIDQRNLKTLIKGTGYLMTPWDPLGGEASEFNEDTGELTMEGSHKVYSPSTWHIWLDPDATCQQDVKWFFELVPMARDEAILRFPKHKERLEAEGTTKSGGLLANFWSRTEGDKRPREVVEIYRYYEKALPTNGMKGRHCWLLADGTILENSYKNPHPNGDLPLHILTDIDIEDQVYGASIIEFLGEIQEVLNALDSNTLYNIATHNVVRLIMDEGASLEDDALSNSPAKPIKVRGSVASVRPVAPPQLMPDAWRFRAQFEAGSKETAGVNEPMMGQTSRETSGFTFQQQINAGNMVRTRLFNKYARDTRNVYKHLLELCIKHWDEPRMVKVLGDEHAFEVKMFDKTDLKGGWDVIAQYGTAFSLDPSQAREQLMQLLPWLEKDRDFNYKKVYKFLRLEMFDEFINEEEVAARREKEAIYKMIRTYEDLGGLALVEPDKGLPAKYLKSMIEFNDQFRISAQYQRLEPELQQIILKRSELLQEALANLTAQAAAPQPASPFGL